MKRLTTLLATLLAFQAFGQTVTLVIQNTNSANYSGSFTGTFGGDGGGLTNLQSGGISTNGAIPNYVLGWLGSGPVQWIAGLYTNSLTLSQLYQTNWSAVELRRALGLSLPTDSPIINGFANSVGVAEIGSTVSSDTLNWSLSGTQVITQWVSIIGSVPVGILTTNDTHSYSSSQTWTLFVSDGATPATATTTLSIVPKKYWGCQSDPNITDGEIQALSADFAGAATKTVSLSPAAQYVYFCFPASWGAAVFTVNGFPSTSWNLVTRNFTNASGYTQSYNIYQSINVLTGTYSVTIAWP